jgi:hypothetical protein
VFYKKNATDGKKEFQKMVDRLVLMTMAANIAEGADIRRRSPIPNALTTTRSTKENL